MYEDMVEETSCSLCPILQRLGARTWHNVCLCILGVEGGGGGEQMVGGRASGRRGGVGASVSKGNHKGKRGGGLDGTMRWWDVHGERRKAADQ